MKKYFGPLMIPWLRPFYLSQSMPQYCHFGRDDLQQFNSNLVKFLSDAWTDISLLAILSFMTGIVWVSPHAFVRQFPVNFFESSGDIVWTQFAYPYVPPPLNSLGAALLCILLPLTTILVSHFWLQNFVDAANAVLGLFYAIVTGTLFQVILKKTIGGLRPHFLTVCEPRLSPGSTGTGYGNIMFTIDSICRGDRARIQNATESFPSGHAAIAWAGFGYLALYLFTHLRIQSDPRPGLWKMILVLAPTLLATYISSSLVLSYNHHGYDVLAGGLIGSTVALFSYRMMFMGLKDHEWSTVPRCRYIARAEMMDTLWEDTHVAGCQTLSTQTRPLRL